MLSDAILKINSEMKGSNNNPYILVVGEFLLQHLSKNPQDAEKILNKEKTIGKSLEEMKKVAEKSLDKISKAAEKKQGWMSAMFTPQEGFEIVMKYFGIKPVTETQRSVNSLQTKISNSRTVFNVNLDDLL